MRSLAVAGLLVFALVLPARADFDSARAAYERGDYGAAFGQFRALAEGGDADAQYMLGYLYGVGRGTPQSYVDAHKWFNLAASRGRSGAVEARDDVARLMTPEQIAEAQRQAREWRPTTAAAQSPQWAPPEEAGEGYAAPSRETVAAIQRLLAELGYAPGASDGVAGAETEQAIRRYQADAGLAVDGRSSEALRAHLAAAAEQRRAAAPAASAVTRAPGAADRSQELVDDLLALADRGERAGAAQPWFLADLRALARRYHWPWRAEVLRDDFRDGDFTANPAWTVVAGNFAVDANLGLKTVVTAPQAAPAEREPEDFTTAILGTILERVTRPEGAGAQTTAQSISQVYVARAIPNAFALELQLTSRAGSGRFEFGPYQGVERASGYRLAYSPGARPSLELVRLSPFGGSVIEAHQEALELEDGRVHTVLWTRDETGVMVVTLDGTELLRAGDRGVAGPFDGLVFVNRGGDYAVREVVVYGAGPAPAQQ